MKGRCIDARDFGHGLTIHKVYDLTPDKDDSSLVLVRNDIGVLDKALAKRFQILADDEPYDCAGWKEKAENETRRADELYDQLQNAKAHIETLEETIAVLEEKITDLDATIDTLNHDVNTLQDRNDNLILDKNKQADKINIIKTILEL